MIRRMTLWLAGAVLALGASCATAPSEPVNLGSAKAAVVAYVDSGRYLEEIAAVAARARAQVERRAAQRKGGEKLAVVFDIDETILSNLPHMRAVNFGYVPELWSAWVARGDAPGIAPVVAVYRTARQLGVAVYFVTGRREADRRGTEKNLQAIGCGEYRELDLKPDEARESTGAFKTAVRRRIVADGCTIVANIGDQQSDLDGGWAEKAFKLPSPFYLIE